jgi:hypothetical protein
MIHSSSRSEHLKTERLQLIDSRRQSKRTTENLMPFLSIVVGGKIRGEIFPHNNSDGLHSRMALVADISLAELCHELEQSTSSSTALSHSHTNTNHNNEEIPDLVSSDDENEALPMEDTGVGDLPSASVSDDDSDVPIIPDEIVLVEEEKGGEKTVVETEATEITDDAEEENGTFLSLADFRRQSEELTSYLDSLKQQRLEKEREDEEIQDQNFLVERAAAFSELDEMVKYINTVKTTFTPPEKEKPQRRDIKKSASPLGQTIAPLTGKGKYAMRGKLGSREGGSRGNVFSTTTHSDDLEADSTLASMSTQLSTPRRGEVEEEEEELEDPSAHCHDQEEGETAFIANKSQPLPQQRPQQNRMGEDDSSSDESEVLISPPCPSHFLVRLTTTPL